MPLTSESGSGSWIRILDPGPAIFVNDLQDVSKKLIFNTIFSAYYFLKVHLHHFSKIKSQKEPQNSRNQGFYHYFCMMIEGSGSGSRAGSGSGSISLTSGSGSGRPKNMWIRIRNTGFSGFPQEEEQEGKMAGSMPLTYGSGSFYFCHCPSRHQQEYYNRKCFSDYYRSFLKVYLQNFPKIRIFAWW